MSEQTRLRTSQLLKGLCRLKMSSSPRAKYRAALSTRHHGSSLSCLGTRVMPRPPVLAGGPTRDRVVHSPCRSGPPGGGTQSRSCWNCEGCFPESPCQFSGNVFIYPGKLYNKLRGIRLGATISNAKQRVTVSRTVMPAEQRSCKQCT